MIITILFNSNVIIYQDTKLILHTKPLEFIFKVSSKDNNLFFVS